MQVPMASAISRVLAPLARVYCLRGAGGLPAYAARLRSVKERSVSFVTTSHLRRPVEQPHEHRQSRRPARRCTRRSRRSGVLFRHRGLLALESPVATLCCPVAAASVLKFLAGGQAGSVYVPYPCEFPDVGVVHRHRAQDIYYLHHGAWHDGRVTAASACACVLYRFPWAAGIR